MFQIKSNLKFQYFQSNCRLGQEAFEDYLNRRLTKVNERFNEIKTYGDDDLDNDDFENDHYEGDEDYDEEVDAVLGRAICALLHSVVKIKIEKQLLCVTKFPLEYGRKMPQLNLTFISS